MVDIYQYIEHHLLETGIMKDLRVLDFGCGDGNYTIPIAKILGDHGIVFAVDKDQSKLSKLTTIANKAKVEKRIQLIKSEDELKIPLKDETIDICLLYNVSCCIIGQDEYSNFVKITSDIYRILREGGKLNIGIKEGKTMLKRIENALPYIEDRFSLLRKEKRKYFDGEKLRPGLFYFLEKK